MSKRSRDIINIKHKSAADKKAECFARAVKKVGGQDQSKELLAHWENHKRSEKMSERNKRESDGFLRGLILSHNLSRAEAMDFFKIGRYKYDRLRNLNPNLPIPKRRPNDNAVSLVDKEFIRIFMKAMETEPGYPCHHRSTPVYMADPNITFVSLHNQYKGECQERAIRALSYDSFKTVVKFLMPTLHLGRTKKDSCNGCFSLELQIKDPETSEQLKQELIAAKRLHLEDAIKTRKAISKLVKSVQNKIAPDDPPLREEPVFIPACFKDPYDRLNRPLMEEYEEGRVGLEESDGTVRDDFDVNIAGDTEEEPSETGADGHRTLRVTVQDFGSGIPLPFYGANQPNHDYYASNITLHNMNFVDCASGRCYITYFDERQAGKDGNSVSSLRWNNLKQYVLEKQTNIPLAECKVLDNCVGQNKSNTTHKFSMLCSLLIFPEGVTDIYFKVGHSHNQSDARTGHAAKAMSKKNLYIPQAVAQEVNKVKGLFAEVLHEKSEVFKDWKSFLDKHFPNMDPGFTNFYIFQFKNGVVDYKELNEAGEEVVVKSKVFCANPEVVKKFILRELFNLSSTSNPVEIVKAKPRLPLLPQKKISRKKIESMRTLYSEIPRSCRWFYPEGDEFVDNPLPVRNRGIQAQVLQDQGGEHGLGVPALDQDISGGDEEADEGGRQDNDPPRAEELTKSAGKKAIGRPKKVHNVDSAQPAILRYLTVSNDGNPPAVAGSSGVTTTTRVPSRTKTKDFIEEGNSDSEESVEAYESQYRSNAPKKIKLKPHEFNYNYDDDSDDDFSVVLEDGGAFKDSSGVGRKDGCVIDGVTDPIEVVGDEYGVDLNHNSGKIVMKIVKK